MFQEALLLSIWLRTFDVVGFLRWIVHIYPDSIVVVLLLLIFAASSAIETVFNDVLTNDSVPEGRLFLIKNHYILIRQFVADINDCFGWILLVAVTKIFISSVTFTFFLVSPSPTFPNTLSQIFLCKTLVYFFMLTFASERLSQKVMEDLIRRTIDGFLNVSSYV